MAPSRLRKSLRSQIGAGLVGPIAGTLITGALAASALPRLAEMAQHSRSAVLHSNSAALTRAMAYNRASCALPGADGCVSISDCAQAPQLLVGGLPAGYSVAAGALSGEGECMLLSDDNGERATFVGSLTAAR